MPPKKKKKAEDPVKEHGESLIKGDFVPVDESDVARAVDVPFTEKPISEIEIVEKRGERKTMAKTKEKKLEIKKASKIANNKRNGNGKNWKEKFKIPGAEKLNPHGNVLIITEKPQAAQKIANALAKNGINQRNLGGVNYYEFERDNKIINVVCAVGHLFTLAQIKPRNEWPTFDIEWAPNFLVKKNDFTKKYYEVIAKLSKNVSEIIVASVDYNELTPILEKGEMKIVKIGEFVDDIDNGRKNKSDFLIPAFNSHGQIKFHKLKKAIKHPIKEDLYKLSLEYGRSVNLTSSHNIFSIRNNKIMLLKTTDLKTGDKILCPKILPIPKNNKREINLLSLSKILNKRDIFVGGKDIARILKERVMRKNRQTHYLNEERIILTKNGMNKLKKARLKNNYSTVKIARKINISQPAITLWENGLKNPTKNNLVKYLRALGIDNKSFTNNKNYCKMERPSFQNLLIHVYKTQHKNFSNFSRATIRLSDLKEKEIKIIKDAYIYGSKNKRNKLPISIRIDKQLIRILGYFLAEGDINQNYRVRFSLGKKNYGHEQRIINEIKEFCNRYSLRHNYYIHKTIRHQIITIDNSVLASLFKNIFKFGDGATSKRIPSLIFNLPVNLKEEFLSAYFLGDGSLSKQNITFNTSSELLAKDLVYLLLQFGILTSTYKVKTTNKGGGPNWHVIVSGTENLKKIIKVWKNHHKSDYLFLSNRPKKDNHTKFGDLILLKINSIKKVKPKTKYVYDLSVHGQNFLAGNGGVCCHNTDYDIEGEVIGMNIVRYICNQPDAERMKFSTLTADEINNAYENRSKTLDWQQGIAGETRHYLDWIYGINLSRAIMDAIKQAGSFRLMSIGRVQGPALNIIVKKEREIQKFKPERYWDIFLDVNDGKNTVEVKYIKDVTKQDELKKFEDLKNKEGIAKTEKTRQRITPPTPFDLTSLQTESYKFYGLTPSKTLEIAQRLYLAGVISYPRTSSQKLPKEIGYDKIIKRLQEKFSFTKFIIKKMPTEGKKTDPAHPSIYPTGEFHSLEGEDGKIYSLIVKRFVSCFCDDALLDNKKINVEVNNLRFTAKGMAINQKGWMEVYPSVFKEKEIPDLNGKVIVKKVEIEEKYTQPPHRYTPASIVSELEKKNLGTKATRASIVETLYNRGYIKEKSIEATSLGISLISSLESNCPIIIDEQLTRNIEKEMDSLRDSKNPLEKEKKILEDTKKIIYKIGEQFKTNKLKIGKDLIAATSQLWEDEKKQAEIGICPVCKEGKLTIKYGKKFSRYFVACNKYPDCKTTFSLPPNALIKTTDKQCPLCGWPMLISIKKAKRPWIFCFNPNCESRKERSNKPENNIEE